MGRTGRELLTENNPGQLDDQPHRVSLAVGSTRDSPTSTRNRSGTRQKSTIAIDEES